MSLCKAPFEDCDIDSALIEAQLPSLCPVSSSPDVDKIACSFLYIHMDKNVEHPVHDGERCGESKKRNKTLGSRGLSSSRTNTK